MKYLTLLMLSGCASMSPTERAWQTLHAIDVAQTYDIARDRCFSEADPLTRRIISRKPSEESVIAWGIGMAILHYMADQWIERSDLPNGWKTLIRSVDLVQTGVTVTNNSREGVHLFAPNRSCRHPYPRPEKQWPIK